MDDALRVVLLAAWSSVAGCAQAHSVETLDGFIAALCDEWPDLGVAGHYGGGYADFCTFDRDPSVLRLRAAIEDGRMAFDAAAAEACRAERRAMVFEDVAVSDDTCTEAFVPLTPIGAPCDSNFECVDGFCQRFDYGRSRPSYVAGGCGVCAPLRGVGAPCAGHGWIGADTECQRGLVCDDSIEGRCRELPGPGGACSLFVRCPTDYYCTNTDGGICSPLREVGRSCSSGTACRSGVCTGTCAGTGDVCTSSADCVAGITCTGTCVEPAAEGAPCGARLPCAAHDACIGGICRPSVLGAPCRDVGCREGLICDFGEGSRSVCREEGTVGLGAACDFISTCGAGLGCADGRCVLVRRIGESCTDPSQACVGGGDCRDGVCQRGSGLGGPCSAVCEEGMCRDGVCVTPPVGTACELGGPTCGELACSYAATSGVTGCQSISDGCGTVNACTTGTFCTEVTDQCEPICIVGR